MSGVLIQRVGLAAFNAAENGFRRFDGGKEDIQDYLRAKLDFIGRSAIEAMREPSEAILAAHHVVPDDTDFRDRARDNWQAMVDAALAEAAA